MTEQKTLNEKLDLSPFDYSKLKGASFDQYLELLGTLKWGDKYLFEEYETTTIKVAMYPGLTGSPSKVIGIELRRDRPLKTTLITVKNAIDMNLQVNTDWHSQGHGRYFLLKKVEPAKTSLEDGLANDQKTAARVSRFK